ncbi:hypothetical protein GOP47_0013479 [Adiantum capillus-veneris]|uniref:Uncharacterized protein n=1 Tax=Adiantum capillus-veneris TaxID=13818 RepID=A0A9D4ZD87_ADICA|nr:hypothetical protein GOP47_0013479 [Adiantum capillus-veneris]
MGFHTYVMDMANKELAKGSSTRPNLAFILGTIVVTLVFLGATFLFLCCYHWAKILKEATEDHMHAMESSQGVDEDNIAIIITIDQLPCKVPVVYMPGQQLPTFIAMPSPYHPPQTPELDQQEIGAHMTNGTS